MQIKVNTIQRMGAHACVALISSFLINSSLSGQSSAGFGGISGIVQDASGSVVPNAKVVVANEAKAIRRELITTASGDFNAPNLVPASGYTVIIAVPGFNAYEVKDITVSVGENVTLRPILTVSGAATQVEVTAAAPVIDAT